jgi:hypothetical protein
MPTGYTAQLEKNGFDVRRWLTEDVIRAFGVCVMMREDSMGLSRDEILDRLKRERDSNSYTANAIKAHAELKDAENRTDEQWKALFEKQVADIEALNALRLAEFNTKKKQHENALEEIIRLAATATGEFEIGVLKFAVEQLTMVIKDDFRHPFLMPVPASVAKYKADMIKQCRSDIGFYEKLRDEEYARNNDRLVHYQSWLNFVDKHMQVPS